MPHVLVALNTFLFLARLARQAGSHIAICQLPFSIAFRVPFSWPSPLFWPSQSRCRSCSCSLCAITAHVSFANRDFGTSPFAESTDLAHYVAVALKGGTGGQPILKLEPAAAIVDINLNFCLHFSHSCVHLKCLQQIASNLQLVFFSLFFFFVIKNHRKGFVSFVLYF